jgi:hypothetical protein
LHQAQDHEQHGCNYTDLRIVWEQAEQKGGDGHSDHRERERRLAADVITDMSEHQATDRPHQKTGREDPEGSDQRSNRVLGRKEMLAERLCEVAIDGKVVPFHNITGDTSNNEAPHCRCISHTHTIHPPS